LSNSQIWGVYEGGLHTLHGVSLAVWLLSKSAPLQAFLWVVFWACMALFWKMGEKGCVLVLKEGDRGIKLRTRLSPGRVMVWLAQGACLVRAKVRV